VAHSFALIRNHARLAHGKHRWTTFVDVIQRSVFLNLAGLQCDVCDAESWVLCDANGIELRGIESTCYASQRANQCSMGRRILSYPKTSTRRGTQDPHEVPTRLANHGIEDRRRDLFHAHPTVADGLPERIQTLRQDALVAQEDGMRLQACALLESIRVTRWLESS